MLQNIVRYILNLNVILPSNITVWIAHERTLLHLKITCYEQNNVINIIDRHNIYRSA